MIMSKIIEDMSSIVGALHDANEIVLNTLDRNTNLEDVRLMLTEMEQLGGWINNEISRGYGNFDGVISSYCKNMCAAIKRVLASDNGSPVAYKCNISPCIIEIKRLFDLQFDVLKSQSSIEQYRKKIMEDLVAAKDRLSTIEYKYKVSIILPAYNKLEYTRMAVESLYRFTDFSKGEVELITIDNGSSDGTREYFASLPNEKKIEFDYNVMGTRAGCIVAEGKYLVGFCNDVLATPRWLDQLIYVMEENPDAALLVPTCNEDAISRLQGIKTNYENSIINYDKAIAFGDQYNRIDSALWEERSLLMPFVDILPAILDDCQFLDASYTQIEFIDDDFSTAFRRAGWKMILAKDTFLHHFGGITLNEGRRAAQNNSLINMRKVYYDKWGVDAWESVGDLPCLELAFQWYRKKNNDRILVVEPRFGTQFLNVKNMYRREGFKIGETTAVVADTRYLPDALPMFDRVVSEDSLSKSVNALLGAYNLILLGVTLNQLPVDEYVGLLQNLHEHLLPGGILIVPIENYACGHYARELVDCAGFNGTYSSDDFVCRPVRVLSVGRLVKGIGQISGMKDYHLYGIHYGEDAEDNSRWIEFSIEGKSAQEVDSLKSVCSWRMMYLVIGKKYF